MATWSSRQSPRSMRSLSRPGVATTTSAPRRSASACRPIDMPPTTVAIRSRTAGVRGERVGDLLGQLAGRAPGPGPAADGARPGCPAVRASSASPKARVLPEPVRPRPRTSRPASEFGSVAAWIGNGSVTPCGVEGRQQPRGHVELGERLDGGQRRGDGDGHRELAGRTRRDWLLAAVPPRPWPDGSAGAPAPRCRTGAVMEDCCRCRSVQPSLERATRAMRSGGPATRGSQRAPTVSAPAAKQTSERFRRGRCSPPAGPSGPA